MAASSSKAVQMRRGWLCTRDCILCKLFMAFIPPVRCPAISSSLSELEPPWGSQLSSLTSFFFLLSLSILSSIFNITKLERSGVDGLVLPSPPNKLAVKAFKRSPSTAALPDLLGLLVVLGTVPPGGRMPFANLLRGTDWATSSPDSDPTLPRPDSSNKSCSMPRSPAILGDSLSNCRQELASLQDWLWEALPRCFPCWALPLWTIIQS